MSQAPPAQTRRRGLGPERVGKYVDFNEDYDTSYLKGKTALVTGGATGIGQGCAVGLAEAGAYVIIADVNAKDAEETITELTGKGHHAKFIKTDVTKWEDIVAAFKAALDFGPEKTVDIVIPAAGIAGRQGWLETPKLNAAGDPEQFPRKIMDVNMDGVFSTTQLALYYFKHFPGNASEKQIVFVASMGGYSSMTGSLEYCTSKWGVRGLFRSMRGAHEILGEGKPKFRCNLLAPSWIKTNMTKGLWAMEETYGIKMSRVEDCVHVVLRMCADPEVRGRAGAIFGKGLNFDLGDDNEGLDSGLALKKNREDQAARIAKLAEAAAASVATANGAPSNPVN